MQWLCLFPSDPSKEIHEIEDEVEASDPFRGFKPENENEESKNK